MDIERVYMEKLAPIFLIAFFMLLVFITKMTDKHSLHYERMQKQCLSSCIDGIVIFTPRSQICECVR